MRRADPFALAERPKKPIPYDFVLDLLAPLAPTTRAMFGAMAVYVEERVVFLLRKKGDADDGVWVSFEPTREAELLALLPNLRRITVLGTVRSWRNLAERSESFEEDVTRACQLLREKDPPLGKLPERLKKTAIKARARKT